MYFDPLDAIIYCLQDCKIIKRLTNLENQEIPQQKCILGFEPVLPLLFILKDEQTLRKIC